MKKKDRIYERSVGLANKKKCHIFNPPYQNPIVPITGPPLPPPCLENKSAVGSIEVPIYRDYPHE